MRALLLVAALALPAAIMAAVVLPGSPPGFLPDEETPLTSLGMHADQPAWRRMQKNMAFRYGRRSPISRSFDATQMVRLRMEQEQRKAVTPLSQKVAEEAVRAALKQKAAVTPHAMMKAPVQQPAAAAEAEHAPQSGAAPSPRYAVDPTFFMMLFLPLLLMSFILNYCGGYDA
eukprot:PLAT14414.1.p1 GENE.PLAT14414.1~~PLAT14414.1.p1  ORF type:complete len:194 (-),score=72.06 PLAT14414.1:123-641(-)